MLYQPARRGVVFILAAPSGAGKTTLSRAALETIEGLEMSISLTTRKPRRDEVDGRDYHFVTEDDFTAKLNASAMAEWAVVHGARYGTPRCPLEDAIGAGRDILLDIDIEGARQLRSRYFADVVSMFVLPPSLDALEERLRGRATESDGEIARRLARAREEMRAYPEFDYLIINADRDESLARLRAVVDAERCSVRRLRKEFAPWKT